MNIDISKIKTKEERDNERYLAEKNAAINARVSEYQQFTDPLVIELLLKKFKDDPAFTQIYAKRLEIQENNPYPIGENNGINKI